VSSILEALRELESQQPPTMRSTLPPSEPPSRVNGGMETVGLAAIGLVIGALLFVGVTAAWSLFPAAWSRVATVVTAARARVDAPSVATHATGRPAWLEGADPPRARLAQATSGAERPRTREIRAGGSAVEVTALSYSPDPGRRSVALRLDNGEVVSLHEHDSARGVEVQLIDKDGVYVRRGGDVTRLSAPAQ